MSLRSVSTSVSSSTSFQPPRWEQTSELSDGLPLTIEVANPCTSTIKLPNLKMPVVVTVNGNSTRLPSITKGEYTCKFYVARCPGAAWSTGSGGNNTQSRCVYSNTTIVKMIMSGPTGFLVDVYSRIGDADHIATSYEKCQEDGKKLREQCAKLGEEYCKNPLTITIDLAK